MCSSIGIEKTAQETTAIHNRKFVNPLYKKNTPSRVYLQFCCFDSLAMSTAGIAIVRVIILDIHTLDNVVVVDLS